MTQLIVNKRGTKLSIENGMYKISNSGQIEKIPVMQIKQILLGVATSVTFEALETAINSHCDVVLQKGNGKPIGRLWSNKFGSIADIRKNQYAFSQSKQGIDFIKKTISIKFTNMLALLFMFEPIDAINNGFIEKCEHAINDAIEKIKHTPIDNAEHYYMHLRGVEGNVSKLYFKAINNFLPATYKFERRSQHPGKDMFNAMLNYAYGILYARVEWAVINAGLDPFVGIMHRDEYNKPVLTYDIIEPFRIWADYIVIELCRQQAVFKTFFEIGNDGAYIMLDEVKRIVAVALNDYLADMCNINGINRSRNTHIELFAQRLATEVKKFNK